MTSRNSRRCRASYRKVATLVATKKPNTLKNRMLRLFLVAPLGLRGGPCPARTWAWVDDDPNDPSRAANAAPAFFYGPPRRNELHSAAHKKAAQNTARLGSLVAPLGLFFYLLLNLVYYKTLIIR